MSADADVAVPFGSKNLGDLSKNSYEGNELLFAILRAVENVGAQKCTGRKLGISPCLIYCHVLVFIDVSNIIFYHFLYVASYYSNIQFNGNRCYDKIMVLQNSLKRHDKIIWVDTDLALLSVLLAVGVSLFDGLFNVRYSLYKLEQRKKATKNACPCEVV